MPIIVMLPGIAAYVLHKNGHLEGLRGMDDAYSAILGFLPSGLKGLAIAALTAAIVASLAGKLNSIGTIFTLDIYLKYFRKKTVADTSGTEIENIASAQTHKEGEEKNMVWVGRMAALVAILIAVVFEWKDLLGISAKGGFTFIQEYTGFISPGVFAMFILGMFWKRTTGAAAVAGLITGLAMSIFFKLLAVPLFGHETWLYTAFQTPDDNGVLVYQIPFLINMGWAFFFTMLVMIVISLAGPKVNPKAFELDKAMFKLKPSVIAMIVATLLILAALYVKFW